MKCLSVWQPWASFLVRGIKRLETRAWNCQYRGPLLIHAAKRWDPATAALFRLPGLINEAFRLIDFESPTSVVKGYATGPKFGAIIGSVYVHDCLPTEKVIIDNKLNKLVFPKPDGTLAINPTEHALGDFGPGRFAICCRLCIDFGNPLPYRGIPGMFDVPDDQLTKEMRLCLAQTVDVANGTPSALFDVDAINCWDPRATL